MNLTRTPATICRIGATLRVALFRWPASAAVELDTVCVGATATVAIESGVSQVLPAIGLSESRRSTGGATHTRPRTSNSAGKGSRFDAREEALRFTRSEVAQGTTTFDGGRFQSCHRWHGLGFDLVEDALAKARDVARILTGPSAESDDRAGRLGRATPARRPTLRGAVGDFTTSSPASVVSRFGWADR